MKRRNLIRIAVALVCLAAMALSAACYTPPKRATIDRGQNWVPSKIAVLPFQKVTSSDGGKGPAWGPLTRSAHLGGTIIKGATESLDSALANYLPSISRIPLVPAPQTGLVYNLLVGRDLEDTMRQEIMATGKKLNADAVMIGFVYRFKQREGGPYSAEEPAAVSFDLSVVRTRDGSIIWRDSFEEKQENLAQNFLKIEQFMKHGMRWYTAQELGSIGVQKLLANFPWQEPGIKKE
jgi:hypothetical protein